MNADGMQGLDGLEDHLGSDHDFLSTLEVLEGLCTPVRTHDCLASMACSRRDFEGHRFSSVRDTLW